jgi:hypothetical protein
LTGPPDKSGETSLEAGLEPLEVGPGPDKSGQPNKSSGVFWRPILALWKSVHGPDKSGPPNKSGGGTGLVR